MLAIKPVLALFVIAAGGFLNAGTVPPLATGQPAADSATSKAPAPAMAPWATMQRAAETAVRDEVRRDLGDTQAMVRLDALDFTRASNRTLEGHGTGKVVFDKAGAVPVQVNVSYDLVTQRIEYVNYAVTGSAQRSKAELLGAQMRSKIADRIGARLVVEFAQQPVDFSLLEITHLASGRTRMMISGNGITTFPGEGAAYTRFVAIADKFSGRVLSVQYELLQEVESNKVVATSIATRE